MPTAAAPPPRRPAAETRRAVDANGGGNGGAFRRRATITVNTRYSRLVQLMKVALPLAALAILALVAAWPSFIETAARKLSQEPGDSELLQPRYFSVDEKGQPFSLTAKRAKESDTASGLVNLDEPEAEMTELDGAWVTLRARTGYYNRQTRLLRMVGAVRILRDDGTEYHTEEAFADVAAGTSWGDVRIVGQGPQGEVAAEGFRMTDRGRTIVFVNQSAVTAPTAAAPSAPAAAVPTPAAPAAPAVPAVPAPPPATATVATPPAPPPAAAPPAAAPTTPPAAPTVWTPPPPRRKPVPPKRN